MRMINDKNLMEHPELDKRLYYQCEHIGHTLYRLRRLKYEGRDQLRGQGRLMSLLLENPDLSQKELTALLDIRQQSVAQLLAKLEQSGDIEKRRSERDQRVYMISLTAKGREEAEALRELEEKVPDITDCLSEEEKEVLSGLLARVVRNMDLKFKSELDTENRQHGCRHDHHGHHSEH